MIAPSVGRVVMFRDLNGTFCPKDAVCAAIVAAVVPHALSSGIVNLHVIEPNGSSFPLRNVPLVQPGEEVPPETNYYCHWPDHVARQDTPQHRAASAMQQPVD